MNNLHLAAAEIARVREAIQAAAPDDEQLLADMLEGETDLYVIAARLLDLIENDESLVAGLREQIDARARRRRRFDARIEASRHAITVLLDAAGLDRLALPEATLTRRMLPPTVEARDPEAVPDEYCKLVKKPDLPLIKTAFAVGALPNWLTFVPARPSLTIRRS